MATKRKSTGKNANKKVVTEQKLSPISITTDIPMGIVELSETQAISVSLIRNALQQEYVAVRRMYRTGSNTDWKPKSAIWLPFTKMDKIGEVICHAYDEGIKLGWGNTYKTTPLIYTFNGDEFSSDHRKEPKPLKLEPNFIEQSLF